MSSGRSGIRLPTTPSEGKKIGLRDCVQALAYIVYYNLVKPRLPAGREYVRRVNAFLEGQDNAPAVPAGQPAAECLPARAAG